MKLEGMCAELIVAVGDFALCEQIDDQANAMKVREKTQTILSEFAALNTVREQLAGALRCYMQWEASLIMDDGAWQSSVPKLSQEHFDAMLALQEPRNEALAANAEWEAR